MNLLTDMEREALLLSLDVALRSVRSACRWRIAVAWLLTRRRFPGRTLLDALVHLPLVLPPVVVGYVLLLLFGTRGPIGGWLDRRLRRRSWCSPRRRRARDRGDVVPADGARDAHLARERGPRARGCRAHAGRRAARPLPHDHAAADAARRAGRRRHCLRAGARRVRRRDHLRVATSRARRARCRWRCTPHCRSPDGDAAAARLALLSLLLGVPGCCWRSCWRARLRRRLGR